MPFPKISEARDLSDEQLTQEINATKKQLFDLRLQQATRQLEKPAQFKHLRHRLAQLMTVEGERKRAATSAVTDGGDPQDLAASQDSE